MSDIEIVTFNPSIQRVTAASNKGPIFDPLAGELHHDGRIAFLSRKWSNLLMLLVRAKGDISVGKPDAVARGVGRIQNRA